MGQGWGVWTLPLLASALVDLLTDRFRFWEGIHPR